MGLVKEWTGQRNRIESLELDPQKYSQLFFDKGANQFNGERAVFSTNGPRTAETEKRMCTQTSQSSP